MAKPLEWERQDGASYAWALGLHYYAEIDDGEWPPCCMTYDTDTWRGEPCNSRAEAEAAMQAHFDEKLAEWAS